MNGLLGMTSVDAARADRHKAEMVLGLRPSPPRATMSAASYDALTVVLAVLNVPDAPVRCAHVEKSSNSHVSSSGDDAGRPVHGVHVIQLLANYFFPWLHGLGVCWLCCFCRWAWICAMSSGGSCTCCGACPEAEACCCGKEEPKEDVAEVTHSLVIVTPSVSPSKRTAYIHT